MKIFKATPATYPNLCLNFLAPLERVADLLLLLFNLMTIFFFHNCYLRDSLNQKSSAISHLSHQISQEK